MPENRGRTAATRRRGKWTVDQLRTSIDELELHLIAMKSCLTRLEAFHFSGEIPIDGITKFPRAMKELSGFCDNLKQGEALALSGSK